LPPGHKNDKSFLGIKKEEIFSCQKKLNDIITINKTQNVLYLVLPQNFNFEVYLFHTLLSFSALNINAKEKKYLG